MKDITNTPRERREKAKETLTNIYGPEIANAEPVADYLTKALDNAERMVESSKHPGA